MAERRVALLAWIAWLVGLVWIAGVFWMQTLQPKCWPLVVLLAAQVFAAVIVAGTGTWHMIRGPRRTAALAWMLLGMAPVCLWATHLSYGVWYAQGRQLDPNLLIRMSRPMFLALADAATRVLYRQRTEGRYVVMIHNGIMNSPQEDVSTMDRHLERMQSLLGRKMKSKVYWVRGPLLGVTGRGGGGWALGSSDTAEHEPGKLPYVDVHEAAHAIIETLDHADYCVPLDRDVPAILSEGWAETQSGHPETFLVQRAWNQRRRRLTLSLGELTSEDWYRRHLQPAYDQGSPLVEYMLQEFGPEKFFELYITCRRKTFETDCQRVLGVTLEELDRAFWNYVEQQVDPDGTGVLGFVQLAPDVDRDLWREFARGHLAATEQVRRLPDRLHAHSEAISKSPQAEPSQRHRVDSVDLLVDGDRWRLLEQYGGPRHLTVASPGGCFRAAQDSDAQTWRLLGRPQMGSTELDCRYQQQQILGAAFPFLGHYSLVVGGRGVWNALSKPLITHIEHVSHDRRDLIRIAFENRGELSDEVSYTGGELYVDPASSWSIRLAELRADRGDDSQSRCRLLFELQPRGDGPPLLRNHHVVWKRGEQTTFSVRSTTSYDFAPQVAAADFSPATYGITLPRPESSRRLSWYLAVSISLALLTLVGGAATLITDTWLAYQSNR